MARRKAGSSAGTTAWLTQFRPTFERILFGLALFGVLVAVHLYIQQGRGFDRGCLGFSAPETVSDTFNCELVTESSAGKILGVSNAVAGMLFYLAVAGLSAMVVFGSVRNRPWMKRARLGLVSIGFAYSVYLSYAQYFVLEELCALCLTSAAVVTLLFIVQLIEVRRAGAGPATPAAARGVWRPVRFYGGFAVLLTVLVGADFVYFNNLERVAPVAGDGATVVDAPEGSGECLYDPEKPPVENFAALVAPEDPIRGNPQSPVTVIEFFDPNCPHCRFFHPVMDTVASEYEDRVRFVFKPIPIWKHSEAQVAAMLAAAREGKFYEMMERQFDMQQPQTGLSFEQLRAIADEIGMDGEDLVRRIQNNLFYGPITKQRLFASQAGVTSVPSVIINGRFVRSRSADCLRQFLDEALAEGATAAR